MACSHKPLGDIHARISRITFKILNKILKLLPSSPIAYSDLETSSLASGRLCLTILSILMLLVARLGDEKTFITDTWNESTMTLNTTRTDFKVKALRDGTTHGLSTQRKRFCFASFNEPLRLCPWSSCIVESRNLKA